MLHYLLYIINLPHLLQIPGGKLVTDGLSDVTKSDNPIFASSLLALLILSYFGFICVLKYMIKEKKEALAAQLVSNAEKHAIDIGAQQLVLKGKDDLIKTLTTENEYLKERVEKLAEDKTMILRDNTEAFRNLGTKMGQQSDIMVNILGTVQQNHENMKLFFVTEVKSRN